MATKKETKPATTKPAKPKADTVIYKDRKYTVLERNEHKVCLTDGAIHFWVKASDVTD